MNLIKTKSFELAVYAKGNVNASMLAIIIPGRLDTKDYIHNTSLVDTLAAKNYYALSFDPPGTWESPGSIELYTTTAYLQAISELISHYDKPTVLLGHSRGGSVAMLSTTNPSVVAVAVIMANYGTPSAPNSDAFQTGFQLDYRDLPPGSSEATKRKQFTLPMNYFLDGAQYDPVTILQKFKKPKLLIYGTRDKFTKPTRVKEVYKTIPEPKMIYSVDSEHDYRRHPKVINEVNRVVIKFLDKFDLHS